MQRPRISIAGLLLLIFVTAIGFAALAVATRPWAGAIGSLRYFALVASLLGIGFGRGTRRVYWTGFALLGWSYVLLSEAPWPAGSIRPNLLAPNLSDRLADAIHPIVEPAGAPGGFHAMPLAVRPGPSPEFDIEDFADLCRSIEALIWAFLGGWVARYFASGRLGREGAVGPAGDGGAGPGSTPTPSA